MKLTLLYLLFGWVQSTAAGATVTAYCHCAHCCGVANGPAANGRMPVVGLTIAGPRWVPLGTRVWIEGIGLRIVTDRLAPAFDNRFDIFVADHRTALLFGVQQRRVTLIK